MPVPFPRKRNKNGKRYKFKIVDSNLCEKPDCLSNQKWTVDELTRIRSTLDSLPRCFTDNLNLDQITGRLQGVAQGDILKTSAEKAMEQDCCQEEVLNHCYWAGTVPLGYNTIRFCGDRFRNNTPICQKASNEFGGLMNLEGILVHEMTHAFQNKGLFWPPGLFTDTVLMESWKAATKWVCAPFVGCKNFAESEFPSIYAASNPLEDMAESVRFYYGNPEKLKAVSPGRYDFVKKYIMCEKEFEAK